MSQRDRKTCPEDAKACSDVQTEVLKNPQTWKIKMRKSPKMWKEVKEEENMGEKKKTGGTAWQSSDRDSEAKHTEGDYTGQVISVTRHMTCIYIILYIMLAFQVA